MENLKIGVLLPHIYVKDFDLDQFQDNSKYDEVEFYYLAKSSKYNSYLIFTRFRDKEFFLELKKKGNRVLIKSEKTHRPSPNYPVHVAISALAKMLNLQVLSSNLNLKEPKHLTNLEYLKDVEFFNKFQDFGEIAIEIGFGSGRHLLYRAENEPNTTFIGIEIHKPSIEQLLKQIEIRNLKNIYVLDFDARHFFETIPSNRVSTIYIHFPVPWDKQPHRRVIQPNFLQEAKRILKVGGILELRTDSENYFQYSLELFLREPKLKMELWKNIPIEIESKYEARWKKMKKNIYNFRLENLDSSPPKESWIVPDGGETQGEREKIEELLDYRVLEKEWFIHIRDILRLRDGRYLLSIVAGSYTYPQHQFILFNGNKIEYLIRKPLDIEINVKIDKVLRELL